MAKRETVEATDNNLMARVGAGEVNQLAVLFERHHKPLFRYFVYQIRDRQLAEDLVQDVFFRMLRYRASYDPAQSFTAWMYRIARNANVDQAAKRRGEVLNFEDLPEKRPEPAAKQPTQQERLEKAQDLALLRRALERLPADKRELLVMARFQNLKYEEIARVLGCEVATVKVRVFRAVRMLGEVFFELAGEKAS